MPDGNSCPDSEWIHTWSRNYGVQYGEVIFTAISCKGNGIASMLRHHLFYPDNKNTGHFVRREDWDELVAAMEEVLADADALDREIAGCKNTAKAYIESGKALRNIDIGNCGNSELLALYNDMLEKWGDYTSYVWSLFILTDVMCPKAEKFIQEKRAQFDSDEKFEEFLRYVTSPIEKSSILKLNHELREVKNNFSEEKLKDICKRYLWLPCLDLHLSPWDEEHLKEYFNTHDFTEDPIPDETVLTGMDMDMEEMRLIQVNRKITYAKDLRDEYRRKGVFYSQILFREIGRRMGLDLADVSYLTQKEIRDFLNSGKKPDPDLVMERRSNGFMIFEKDGEICCVCGPDIRSSAKELGFTRKKIEKQDICGITGSKGRATGTAKIIMTEEDLHKVSDGDVIVALTTNPAYTPAMAKAVAFVTDQGGITCHAAIVAREMKKPCVVGTQNATALLNDGDLIEVDADKGTVRKLK